MTRAGEVAADHGYDDLRQTRTEIVRLNDERRPPLSCAQVGIRKEHQDNVTPLVAHRRHPFPGDPNQRQMTSDEI